MRYNLALFSGKASPAAKVSRKTEDMSSGGFGRDRRDDHGNAVFRRIGVGVRHTIRRRQ